MKTSLIIFGVIFLVIGGVFYFYPTQTASATTTTDPQTGNPDVRTSSASIQIPKALTFVMLIIGAVLLLLGAVLGNPAPRATQRATVTDTKEVIERGNGRRKVLHSKTIRRER